jgi:hypothetical protein
VPSASRIHATARSQRVRAVARDRDLDGQGAAAVERVERTADERRLAVAARRDEEDLLARGQVLGEPAQLVLAVDERGGRHDLAVDEGVLHVASREQPGYAERRNGYGV